MFMTDNSVISLYSFWIYLTNYGIKFTAKHPAYKEFPPSTYMTAMNH
jgi:hypothetical protein